MVTLHLRRDTADHRAQRPNQRGQPPLGDRHRHTQLTAGGGDLTAGEPATDDQHPARTGIQPSPQPVRVVRGAQHEQPVEPGLCLVRPRAGPHPGGDEQPVESHLLAVSQNHLLAAQVKTSGRDSQPPVHADLVAAGKRGPPRISLAHEDLLGQRRPVVRGLRLVPDHGQRAGEALPAQRPPRPQPSQGRPDNDNTSGAPERLLRALGGHLRLGPGLPIPGVLPFEEDGLDRAGRRRPRDLLPLRVVRIGVVQQRLIPRMVNTSGAAKAHCAYPWHRVRSTTIFMWTPLPHHADRPFRHTPRRVCSLSGAQHGEGRILPRVGQRHSCGAASASA